MEPVPIPFCMAHSATAPEGNAHLDSCEQSRLSSVMDSNAPTNTSDDKSKGCLPSGRSLKMAELLGEHLEGAVLAKRTCRARGRGEVRHDPP